jgi:hypothetical protein
MIADARQSLMMKPRQQTRLALELFPHPLFGEKRLFQGDNRVQTQIDCFINRAHAALA